MKSHKSLKPLSSSHGKYVNNVIVHCKNIHLTKLFPFPINQDRCIHKSRMKKAHKDTRSETLLLG